MDKIVVKAVVPPGTPAMAGDFLAARSGLSKSRIKDAMNKGAVWIQRKSGPLKRLRKATALLSPGDRIEMHYDQGLLALAPPRAECLKDEKHYSVWYKPSGLMAQGTMHGDHCSVMRQAEIFFQPRREVFLVHRLDREASGIMLLAHSRDAAARLSELFRENRIKKEYRVEVLGNPAEEGKRSVIELPLDGKTAVTEYEVVAYDPDSNTATAAVTIKTGRLHQIRRHFAMIGHPVIGDPRYGTGNKNTQGMKLIAVSLLFFCPFRKKEVAFTLPSGRR
jgi:tRNA pseudouridine32 synthase/23S rRNA pseudouridine746 synthase